MTEEVHVVTDAPKPSRTKALLNRHKPKLVVAATAVGAATVFVLGRKSRDVVESVEVDVDVNRPD